MSLRCFQHTKVLLSSAKFVLLVPLLLGVAVKATFDKNSSPGASMKENEGQLKDFGDTFARSAAIDADESRRIYAISIPRIFQNNPPPPLRLPNPRSDRRFNPQGFRGSEPHLPSHRPQPRPFKQNLTPPPPPPHPSNDRTWNQGLRLIVSGPVEPPSSESPRQDEFYHYDEVKDHRQFYNPHDRTYHVEEPTFYDENQHYGRDERYDRGPERKSPNQDSEYHLDSEYTSGDHFSVDHLEDSNYPQRPENSPYFHSETLGHSEINHGTEFRAEYPEALPEEPQHNDDYLDGDYHDELPHEYYEQTGDRKTKNVDSGDRSLNSAIKVRNQPYLRQTVDINPSQNPNDEGNKKAPNNEEDSRPNENPRKISAEELNDEIVTDAIHNPEYYDNLYEEFMEANYDDYYNDENINPPADYEYDERASDHPPQKSSSAPVKKVSPLPDSETHSSENSDQPSHSNRKKEHSIRPEIPETDITHFKNEQETKFQDVVETTKPASVPVTSSPTRSLPPPSSAPKMNWPIKPRTEKTTQIPTTEPPSTSPSSHPYKNSAKNVISLSEILQGIGISLPQFLVQLKMHNSDLKQFTSKLEKRALSKFEFKRAHGNVGELLKILDESSSNESSLSESTSQEMPSKKTSTPNVSTKSEVPTTTTTAEEDDEKDETEVKNSEVTTLETSSTTTSTQKPNKKPKIIGFKPSVNVKNSGIDAITPNISVAKAIDSESMNVSENTDEQETTEESFVPKPYKPTRVGWRERMQHNRGMVGSRLGSTTRRPKARPEYGYYGGDSSFPTFKNIKDDISSGDNSEESSKVGGNSVRDPNERITSIIGLTEGTPLGGNYDHPRYDKDPNSLNIATRSAIMAAGILGGIAMAVFITILVVVMYRNHAGKKRLRIPLPLSLSGDDSTSSTPPLYVKRPRYAVTTRSSKKHTDFWGTLRKKFDPYSLSSSSASYY